MSFALFGSFALLLPLQPPQGVVSGTVLSGATSQPLSGLVVTLADLDRSARTDSAGRYVFRAVGPGPHHLSVRYPGFAPRTLHALVPAHGTLEINVALTPVQTLLPAIIVRRLVSVGGTGSDQTTAVSTRERSTADMRNDPMRVEPDVLTSLSGGVVATHPETPSGLHVRGGAADQVAYALDGIPVFSPYHTAGVFSAWNPDAIAGVQLISVLPAPGSANALSGTVSAATRAPGQRRQTQASLSTTQARITVDGPLGETGAGFLIGIRSGFPGMGAPRGENSYVRGESGDMIAKLEMPAVAGQLRILTFASADETTTAVTIADVPLGGANSERNFFGWGSRSLGAEWTRDFARTHVLLRSWSASGDAEARWAAAPGAFIMKATRRDRGMLFTSKFSGERMTTTTGARVEAIQTTYVLDALQDSTHSASLRSHRWINSVFVDNEMAVGDNLELRTGGSLTQFAGKLRLLPYAELKWSGIDQLTVSASYAESQQFVQSLRNTEHVTGNVFPAELFVDANSGSVPVARGNQLVLAANFRASTVFRAGVQAFTRRFHDVALVASTSGEPFATRPAGNGHGAASGFAAEAAASTSRLGLTGSYAYQRVRFAARNRRYVPQHGTSHAIEAGVIWFPAATMSVRLGLTGLAGRRASVAVGAFEWESCNLIDRGCEFGGSPRTNSDAVGESRLPSYARADLGLRKHWHVRAGSRDVEIALFGSATNILGRRNVLTLTKDPVSGALSEIGMRPFAPLVLGLDWRF